MAVERLLRSGFNVAIPIIDEGYDILATIGRKCWRIQVKATADTGPCGYRVGIRCGGARRARYKPGAVDAFVAVHIGRGHAMLVPARDREGRAWIGFAERHRYGDFRKLKNIRPGR